ncbi:MAG: filamentous hemagglutinin N-terminal domain-containing protein [Xenococcaceae cyanobacterium MO_188.B32]|nr:filamentous hemagglutinin N-terminal domain-containing protein [Xenococcaceae cyanobacterium MO_188.B32]
MENIITFLLLHSKTETKDLWFTLGLILCSFLGNTVQASAQITPDTTLPTNSIATPNANGDLITITGGTNVGNNLFHSFQEFSVLSGQTAFFDNGATIENIFSRVTGSSVSNIEGIIKANGMANLFLINPNGIIFGENATLNIGGSFIASTAESIQFSDGSFYSAVEPQAPPLLEINIPLGLQYGAEPGNIIVRGVGNNTGFSDPGANDYSLIKDFRPSGLQVRDGKSLALLGGNIALDGGNLTAAEGHIELGAVAGGLVKFNNNTEIWTFDYQSINSFQDIDLVNAASVEVSGNSSGTVNVQGQNISLADASAILANTSGDGTAGSITLNGAESVNITGVSQNNIPFVSVVSTDTTTGSTGAGADLSIDTSYLLVAGGAQVNSAVFGSGEGGTLNVKAERVELISGSRLAGSSGLFAPIVPGATGNGGNINVKADSLLVAGGAQAFTLSVSSGKAGDFNIKAQEIELNGTSPNGTPSGLFSNTFANGDGGNLIIDTDTLKVADGADIGSTVGGLGTAGNIDIKANTIELTGLSSLEDPSRISTSVEQGATGLSGDITIETNSLTLSDGTQIGSNVFGSGNAGNVTITAQDINLTGLSPIIGQPSGLFAIVSPNATGNSGNLTITTDNLRVSEGAQIAVSTGGSGAAGNLTVTAFESVELTGNAIESGGGSSGLFSSAVFGDGNGGNIDLTTDRLTIKDGATISASNFLSGNADVPPGTGKAGNIEINANTIELNGIDADTPSSITAATFAGGGGNIIINSETITAKNSSQITAETLGEGAGGSITMTATDVNIQSNAVVSSSTSGAGDAGTISVASESLNINNQGKITTSSIGEGQAGDINLASDRLETNRGLITATSEQTGGGDINIATESITLRNNSLISTSVLDSNGGGGNITIDNSNLILARNNSDIRANAVFGPGGNINITTELIFTDLTSDIDASSQFGVDGVVEIKSPESDKELNTAILPENIEDPTGLITASCPISNENTFAVTGNGGIPNSPYQTQSLSTVWHDLRPVNEEKAKVASVPAPVKEAVATIINADGELELVALTPLSTHRWVKSSCTSSTNN